MPRASGARASRQPAGNLYPFIAGTRIPGSFAHDGAASKCTSFGVILWAVLWLANQIGLGQTRNGAWITVFCARSNIRMLWTVPVPDWISRRVWPGKAPQG